MRPPIGISEIVIGVTIRISPLLVIVVAALATRVAAHHSVLGIIAAFGKAYNDSRYVPIVWLILPVIGLLKREGLQERAQNLIGVHRASALEHIAGDYMGEHWLASFALLALDPDPA